ncbi:MAG: single-stranded DNA-binding protein [Lachnospiraceae bacterium]|nr:single-stranded DNA-binding protein [Lachnospiraceae bacterium]
MNKIILMGRLTRDPEVRYTQGANPTAVARYSLAVDRKFKHDGGITTDFFHIVAFGNRADFSEKYLRKGMKMLVAGRVQTGYYDNKDGIKVPFFEVVVEEQEFAESKNAVKSGEANDGVADICSRSSHGLQDSSGSHMRSGIHEDADGFLYSSGNFDEELPFD